jgi:hypothetical protein
VAETNTPAAVDQASSAKGDSTPAVAMNIWPTWMK